MIDYGLFALIVVVLSLIFLAFTAWRGIVAEGKRIFSQTTHVDAQITALRVDIQRVSDIANDANRIAIEVQTSHYKSLLRRIDDAEAASVVNQKQYDVLVDKIASLGGRLTAFHRHHKNVVDETQTEKQVVVDDNQIPMFAGALNAQNSNGKVHVNTNFGRVSARK